MEHKCGVLGIYNKKNLKNKGNYFEKNTSNKVFKSEEEKNYFNIKDLIESLDKLQHRGQESCGIYLKSGLFDILIRDNGLVKQVFNDNILNNLKSQYRYALGHTRYSTSGNKNSKNEIQPFSGYNNRLGKFFFVFNGNIPYNKKYKTICNINIDKFLDTELIKIFFEKEYYSSWESLLNDFIEIFERAYCIILLTYKGMYILRDKYGVRPLCYGETKGNFCVCSESVALTKHNYVRDIKPGELCLLNENGIQNISILSNRILSTCLFEYIYFFNEKSNNVIPIRYNLGILLAKKDQSISNINNKCDYLVCGMPNTAIVSAKAYAEFLNFEYVQFIKKNKLSKRTFILKNNEERESASKLKYIINENIDLTNKHVIIVDDSIVRGITLKLFIQKLSKLKPKSIHIRISSPPVKFPCYYGVDIPDSSQLIAYDKDYDEIKEMLNIDSIKYIDIKELVSIFPKDITCYGCFNNDYNNYDW